MQLMVLRVILLSPLCSFIVYFQIFYHKHASFLIRKKIGKKFSRKIFFFFLPKNKNDLNLGGLLGNLLQELVGSKPNTISTVY